MKVNHLNLTVDDVVVARAFLETYFGLKCIGSRSDGFAALMDENGLVLTLMKGKHVQYPRTFHIGFVQENELKVDELNLRLKQDGFKVEPPQHAHGYTFYVNAPGGFVVEVLC